jgi:phosphoribosylamine--glycine ligase
MRVLLVGSGGREHALGWKLAMSPHVDRLISLPGNPGLAELGSVIGDVAPTDPEAVVAAARDHEVDLVVIGPEGPLAAGLVDALQRDHIEVFGPTKAAARLESSKAFAKQVMAAAGVPTAQAEWFDDQRQALAYLDRLPGPFVVKADGLAAGKGVLVTEERGEAFSWVERCLSGGFGEAGHRVLIEEYLSGPEVSVFALCWGEGAVALEPARDYKRLLEGDAGPNTGGMGSYSPVEDIPIGLVDEVMEGVIRPVLAGMAAEGHPYRGFLYAGMVLTSTGPKVLEFNCRLGDPETQVVIPRLEDDLIDLFGSMPQSLRWSPKAAVNVVLAADGYPEAPITGRPITGLDRLPDDVLVFHAGTCRQEGSLLTQGGRVLNIVGLGDTVLSARNAAYEAVDRIEFGGKIFRKDIAG